MNRHWSHDPAKYRADMTSRARRADVILAVLAFIAVAWPMFWLVALLSRAVALDGAL